MINFDYQAGVLEGADPVTGREYCWFRGDSEVVISHDGVNVGTLAVPYGATVVQVKALIREDAKRAR